MGAAVSDWVRLSPQEADCVIISDNSFTHLLTTHSMNHPQYGEQAGVAIFNKTDTESGCHTTVDNNVSAL